MIPVDRIRKDGWLIHSDEAIQRDLTKNHSVFIYHDGINWFAERCTWKSKEIKGKVFSTHPNFNKVYTSAKRYVSWFTNR
jgi:hypothetical protein